MLDVFDDDELGGVAVGVRPVIDVDGDGDNIGAVGNRIGGDVAVNIDLVLDNDDDDNVDRSVVVDEVDEVDTVVAAPH